MKRLAGRLITAAVGALAVKMVFALGFLHIAWWLAALIAFVLVFVGDWIATSGGEVEL